MYSIVTIVGTGINPGDLMHSMVIIANNTASDTRMLLSG